jgi:transposase
VHVTQEPLQESTTHIAALAAKLAAQAQQLELLAEENRWLKQQLFGRSSEKRPAIESNSEQARLVFNEAEAVHAAAPGAAESITIPAHTRAKKGGRRKLPLALPRIEVLHDLGAAERVCAHDGAALVRIGEEVSEEIDYQPATLRVLRHVRAQYACPCCERSMKTAPVPARLLPKSQASASLLAHIATAKYADGLPLHRQEAQFARLGIELPRATMARWMIEAAERLVPLVNLLNDEPLSQPLLHMDETRLQVLKSDKPATSDHWMWVRAAGPPGRRIVLFDHDPSRAGAVPKRLLAGFTGCLLTDGYEPYEALAREYALVHAGCLAHARRRFEEARRLAAGGQSQAAVALDYIGQLYGIERTLKESTPEERLAVRRQRSAPVMMAFKAWLERLAPDVLPQGSLGKAIHYTLAQWDKLARFLDHGLLPLDNNRCENAIRPFVIGRKNWLFSDTAKGATASARLYSLIETAKANGIEPHAYLHHLFTHLPTATTVEAIEALLPWHVNTTLAKR